MGTSLIPALQQGGNGPERDLRPPSYQLSKHIASLISPLAGEMDSLVRNSKHFVEVMAGLKVEEDEMLVSFDVSSLITNLPI